MKRQTKRGKKTFTEKLSDEAKTSAKSQNIAALYKTTKTLTGGFRNSEGPVKDGNRNVITGVAEQNQRWK